MKYLIDSDWIIDGVGRHRSAHVVLDELMKDGVAVSIVTLGEVFEGAFSADDPQAELQVFRRYFSAFAVVPLTDPIMETFARIRADLRLRGMLIPDIDIQIAATALQHDLTLVTGNFRHFTRVSGLRLHEPDTAAKES